MFGFGKAKKAKKAKKSEKSTAPEPRESYWDGEGFVGSFKSKMFLDKLQLAVNQNNALISNSGEIATDSENNISLKMNMAAPESISVQLANWFASHGFIGYQMCAILAQNWLINKACTTPARDATRNGYDIVATDGTDISDETIRILQKFDKRFRVRWHCEQFVRMGRIFGTRIALFDIDSDDPEFYEKPFNLDGVTKGSYKGIVQVDPYWCVPILVGEELSNPASRHFYEPTYWQINGKKYHRSHLMIFRNGEVPDLIKPQYLYGGLPTPQLIMERVYGAERTASESLGLVTSKRSTVWLTNMAAFMADADSNAEKLRQWIEYRDNYGVKVGDKESDLLQQFDTALGDLDEVIMTQYQLVAAAANVPATKLLGTTPKGFNSTGEGEEKNYHEELESIQEHDLSELVERHHQLVMKAYGQTQVETFVSWRPVDSPSAKELAERNQLKANTYSALVQAGAVDGEDIRFRLINDPDSGFHDMGEQENDDDKLLSEIGLNQETVARIEQLGVSDEESHRGQTAGSE